MPLTTVTYPDNSTSTRGSRASGTFNQSWNLTSVGNITSLPTTLRPAGATTALNLTWAPTFEPQGDNNLRSADIDANGSADVSFQYDALGRRVARTGTGGSVVFVQMDQQTIADYPVGGAASTPTYRYVVASYIDEPVVRKGAGTGGTIHYYHRNQQYSVTAITTAAGAIAERYAYTAYGLPTILNASATIIATSAISNRYTYTGREWDATLSLHHFRARWMSPFAGRFLSRDPIGYEGSEWNSFEVMGSSPIAYQDPQGTLYGNWCGPFRSDPGAPIEGLDAACQAHDKCLAAWRQFIIPCNVLRCDMILCMNAVSPWICWGSPNPISCRAAATIIAGTMCNPLSGNTTATNPFI